MTEPFDKKSHWENIYKTKELKEVSWYQPVPQVSLDFIENAALSKDAAIIDIGGGDSFLVDHLLRLGYTNITVLDISKTAIEKAKNRLGAIASRVKWVVSDVLDFNSKETFDLWHDRAAFHFLTTQADINKYVQLAEKNISPKGRLIIGTFSESGPKKCSGIEISQYNEDRLVKCFSGSFTKLETRHADHPTPFNTVQNFIFCGFQKNN